LARTAKLGQATYRLADVFVPTASHPHPPAEQPALAKLAEEVGRQNVRLALDHQKTSVQEEASKLNSSWGGPPACPSSPHHPDRRAARPTAALLTIAIE
jgi:hypothetical protein